MSDYFKYQHVEKLSSVEVDGILTGVVYVFPKIDGTNAHAWYDGEKMRYGSRNRELSLESDNAGFMNAMVECRELTNLCVDHPNLHVFGEWLVPHSLKTYKDSAWRKFYVFDMIDDGSSNYLHYDKVSDLCTRYGLEFIAPLCKITNPTKDQLFACLDKNDFLVKDGEGVGEGIVLKNYLYSNKYGRQTWAKIVTSEFKDKHRKTMGAPIIQGSTTLEQDMVEKYVTLALVDKTISKIITDRGSDGWQSAFIGQLLGTVFHDLVVEHTWDFCKKNKMPTINFKALNRLCVMRVKQLKKEIF